MRKSRGENHFPYDLSEGGATRVPIHFADLVHGPGGAKSPQIKRIPERQG